MTWFSFPDEHPESVQEYCLVADAAGVVFPDLHVFEAGQWSKAGTKYAFARQQIRYWSKVPRYVGYEDKTLTGRST